MESSPQPDPESEAERVLAARAAGAVKVQEALQRLEDAEGVAQLAEDDRAVERMQRTAVKLREKRRQLLDGERLV
jgi:hypothetical protein